MSEGHIRKIALIGAGGIQSWFAMHLKDVLTTFSLNDVNIVTIYDNDVVEEKNILRSNQNYIVEDLMNSKAEVLAKKYGFLHKNMFIDETNVEQELSIYNDIILGVDNHKTRKLMYEFCLKHKKYLLDMRAQKTQFAYYVLDHNKPIEYYIERHKFNNEMIMERRGSCQLQSDIETDHIENANKIVAFFCAYGVYLKQLRHEELSTNEYSFLY